ncbi:uncharacterized protein MELLADRAFT_65443 [Melampsora larici-populina 98AG31]|uniref:Uncharacterized protein n=1 Tax=Melampsora larici-populina (strain 98AG31 / pathotype 3-4-7) TaxID=747676 RepID=F4RVC8_MELLP|nr:uncharacterized protein MELLADRAFT_65443 [Melampsora larici-populina 98AG31]EGG03599.1 hypothetical protein MELLADRAFT_65443 [Melampsora larici-populina 98AG31]
MSEYFQICRNNLRFGKAMVAKTHGLDWTLFWDKGQGMSSSTLTFQILMAFEWHSCNISRLSKTRDFVPNQRLMSAYLQWVTEYDVQAFGVPFVNLFLPGKIVLFGWFLFNRDLERLFDSGLGDPKLKEDFIKHINKEAERLGSKPEILYLPGNIHWKYKKPLHNRAN